MKLRSSDSRSAEELRTERQWAKAGFVVKQGEIGEIMRINGYSRKHSAYFAAEQVRPGSKDEIYAFFEPERERRRKNDQIRRARKKAEKLRELARQAALEERKRSLESGFAVHPAEVDNPSGTVVFDLETTGLDSMADEILQISAIDGDGNVLLNTLVRPYQRTSWPNAQRIHGIFPEDVANAPQLHELIPRIRGIFERARLLISYNGEFDMSFLEASGIQMPDVEHIDVMREFAPIYGEYSEYHGDYKWQNLTTCARYYGYEFKAHDSLEDVKATLFCYQQLKSKE